MEAAEMAEAAKGICGCAVASWETPAPGDRGVRCAECGWVTTWEWLERYPRGASAVLSAQRRHDPAGFEEWMAAAGIARAEVLTARREGRAPGRRRVSRRERRGAREAAREAIATAVKRLLG